MILLSGATGTVGRLVAAQLAAAGVPFRAVVRSDDKGRQLGGPYVVGDFDDPRLREAFVGGEVLFLNSAASGEMVRQQGAAIEAARAAGVARIVKLSSAGVDDPGLTTGRWHGAVEAQLRGSGLRWSVLRANAFMQNLLRSAPAVKMGKLVGAFGAGRVAYVDAVDLAACAVALLRQGRDGQTFVATGPDNLTYAEIAARMTDVVGHAVAYVDVPVADMVTQLQSRGVPAEHAAGLGELMASIAQGRGVLATSAVRDLTGRAPRSLDDFLHEHIAAFR